MTKTFTQKQMDRAKNLYYAKGYRDAMDSPTVEDALESAEQIKSWSKWEQFDFDWSMVVLGVVCLGVVIVMIV